MTSHEVTRVRHALRYRLLTVARVESLSRGMQRLILTGDDLDGFVSLSFDDHVKVFFPCAAGVLPVPVAVDNGVKFANGEEPPAGRDFTPRRFDAARKELALDMGVHGDGPAARWARSAVPGSRLGVAGPRGSAILPDSFAWNLLIGDETALPAIARRLDELPDTVDAVVIVEVDDALCEIELRRRAGFDVRWVHRHGATRSTVDEAVAATKWPDGPGFAWIAGEASMARRIRRELIDRRGFDVSAVKAAAYWTRGDVSRHEVIAD